MSGGRIEQVGTPDEVYEEPATAWVADFLGVSNLMDGVADGARVGGSCVVRVGDFALVASGGDIDATGVVKLVIRPERVTLEPHGAAGENKIPAMVERTVYTGPTVQLLVRLAAGALIQAMVPNRGDAGSYEQGTPVTVAFPADALRVLRMVGDQPGAAAEEEAPSSAEATA
jgi:ABC-type Fe3+/spermidine/putrescine transport system ATPase subunit